MVMLILFISPCKMHFDKKIVITSKLRMSRAIGERTAAMNFYLSSEVSRSLGNVPFIVVLYAPSVSVLNNIISPAFYTELCFYVAKYKI
jgi:hypothetical protein